jgi:hypothetical protein
MMDAAKGADVRIEIEGSSAAPSPHVRKPHRRELGKESHEIAAQEARHRGKVSVARPGPPAEQDAPLIGRSAQEVDVVNVLEASAVGAAGG